MADISVRLEIKSGKAREDLEAAVASLEGFRLEKRCDSPSSDCLVILEIGNDGADLQKELQAIHLIQDSGGGQEIFLTSPRFEPNLLLAAMRAGAREFFPQPINRNEVRSALLKFKEWRAGRKACAVGKKTRIVNVIGSKGGIGTTTIAVNLATGVAELPIDSGNRPSVVLVDMNLLFGQISLFLNVEPAFDWGQACQDISRVDSTYLMTLLSKHRSGIYVLPSPTGLEGLNGATPEAVGKLLTTLRGAFDFVVIDAGHHFDGVSAKVLESADTVLLVTLLDLPNLTNLKRLLTTFERLGYPQKENIKIVANRYHRKSKAFLSVEEAEESIGRKIFWLVPNDYHVTMSAINQGKSLAGIDPKAEIARSIRELAFSFLPKGENDVAQSAWRIA